MQKIKNNTLFPTPHFNISHAKFHLAHLQYGISRAKFHIYISEEQNFAYKKGGHNATNPDFARKKRPYITPEKNFAHKTSFSTTTSTDFVRKTVFLQRTKIIDDMAAILKLKEPYFGRLNNAEYTYFANQICNRITAVSVETLHIPEAAYKAYAERAARLVDLVAQSRVSEETAQIAEVDKQEDELIVYLMATFRNAKSSPIAAKKAAGTTLYNATKPYVGAQRLPQRQQVQTIQGLLNDLAKGELTAHVQTLGLADEVSELSSLNARYSSLLDARVNSRIVNAVEAAKPIRLEMNELYDEMITTVWAFSIATPSKDLTNFVVFVNKLIDDTNTAYNQRMAQSKKKEEETSVE